MNTLKRNRLHNLLCRIPYLLMFLLAPWCLRGNILLTIDVSNINDVTISSTGAASLTGSGGDTGANIVNLQHFFVGAENVGGYGASDTTDNTLLAEGITASSTTFINASSMTVHHDQHLALYWTGNTGTVNIGTTNPAFSDTVVGHFNMSNWTNLLPFMPSPGATGTIQAGASSPVGTVFGQWQAVPEPSTWALILGGVSVGTLMLRRRLRKS